MSMEMIYLYTVSIIVPVYNVEKYLDKCLNSLVNQTLNNIQIIIVNDGSTDNSQAVINDYMMKFNSNIISLIKENGGLSDARNYGLKYAEGEYIGFVDPDDWVELDMYEKLYNYAKDKNADIVISDFIFEPSNQISKSKLEINKSLTLSNNPNLLFEEPSVCNKLFKRSLFEEYLIKFPFGLYHEDRFTIVQLYYYSKSIYYIGEAYYHYLKQRENSITTSINMKKFDDIIIIIEKIDSFLTEKKCNKSLKEAFYKHVIEVYISFCIRAIIEIRKKDKRDQFLKNFTDFITENFPLAIKNNDLGFKQKFIVVLLVNRLYTFIKILVAIKKVLKKYT